MTSLSSSFQLSPYVVSIKVIESVVRAVCTLPLGGLVNHNVHMFMSGCLTLKLLGSWNTVRTSLSSAAALVDFSWLSPEGEMGIVSSGTCWSGFGAVATSAIMVVYKVLIGFLECGTTQQGVFEVLRARITRSIVASVRLRVVGSIKSHQAIIV